MKKTNTISAGSQPALKHVLASPARHAQIMKKLNEIQELFIEKATARGIPIKHRRKGANVPNQADAIEYFMQSASAQGDFTGYFVEELIQKAKGAQP